MSVLSTAARGVLGKLQPDLSSSAKSRQWPPWDSGTNRSPRQAQDLASFHLRDHSSLLGPGSPLGTSHTDPQTPGRSCPMLFLLHTHGVCHLSWESRSQTPPAPSPTFAEAFLGHPPLAQKPFPRFSLHRCVTSFAFTCLFCLPARILLLQGRDCVRFEGCPSATLRTVPDTQHAVSACRVNDTNEF